MVILVSLLTAALFGSGDFFGGLAAKRATVTQVVVGSHLIGLIGVSVASVLIANSFSIDDFILGAIGGAFGGIGVAFLYRRLAIGPMHVVAPLTAISSAVVPTTWGILTGERPSLLAWTGIALGLVAIAMVSSTSPAGSDTDGGQNGHGTITVQAVAESLLAGCGFGAFFIFLDATDASSAPWPIVAARLCTSILLIVVLTALRRPVVAGGSRAIGLIAATGLFDTAANIGFLYATNRGSLAVVAVLTSLYPIATILLARSILAERMSRSQGIGVGGALAATALIALG